MKRLQTICFAILFSAISSFACQVEIVLNPAENNYVAQVTGVDDYTLVWQDGTIGDTYPVSNLDSLICVNLVTTDTFCNITTCYDIIPQFCSVSLELDTVTNTVCAIADGIAPFTYIWETGETSECINYFGPGVYCVTVVDAVGCYVYQTETFLDGCGTDIYRALDDPLQLYTANTGTWPFTYLWSDGSTDSYVTAAVGDEYCVTVTDATGCVATDCYIVDSTDCSVIIHPLSFTGYEYTLITETSGIAPFEYEWSTGEITPEIFVNSTGTYCVTIIDATGCVSSACTDIFVDCNTFITASDTGGLTLLTANGYGNAPFEFVWHNGETGSVIEVFGPGEYCVDMIDAQGCHSSACYIVGNNICQVEITEVYNSDGLVGLQAVADGVPPFEFIWSDGSVGDYLPFPDPNQDYCVTVFDASGCAAEACWSGNSNCYVNICLHEVTGIISLEATAFGNPPFQFTWNTGEVGDVIVPTTSGQYCVEMTDANGCVATTCYTVDFPFCEVEILEIPDSLTGDIILFANGNGAGSLEYFWNDGSVGPYIYNPDPNFTYCVTMVDTVGMCEATACQDIGNCNVVIYEIDTLGAIQLTADYAANIPADFYWSTGETTQTIAVYEPGTYCVEAVFANGCVAMDCYEVVDTNYGCWVQILESIDTGGNPTLSAFTLGMPPFNYEWSNGETTESILINSIGEYCVTVTNALGEVCTDCHYYDLPVYTNDIVGELYLSDPNSIVSIVVELFKINDTGPAELVDSFYVLVHGGVESQYYFNDVPDGEYYVRASQEYDGTAELYVPTYHFSSITSDDAQIITTPHLLSEWHSILMVPVDLMNGPGAITGVVTDDMGRSFAVEDGVSVILTDLQGSAMDYEASGADGQFKITNIALGEYYLVVDVPGLPTAKKRISITADDPVRDGIVIEVSEEGITVGVKNPLQKELSAIPNPASNFVQVAGLEKQSTVQLFNINGSAFSEPQELVPGQKLWVGDLVDGVYFLKVQNAEKETVLKILINN